MTSIYELYLLGQNNNDFKVSSVEVKWFLQQEREYSHHKMKSFFIPLVSQSAVHGQQIHGFRFPPVNYLKQGFELSVLLWNPCFFLEV